MVNKKTAIINTTVHIVHVKDVEIFLSVCEVLFILKSVDDMIHIIVFKANH